MPEGPSIVILREAVQQFSGKKIIAVTGNSKIDQARLLNQKVLSFETWGKHFLIRFKDFSVRNHFLMFGSYTINERKEGRPIRLGLTFKNGELNFYSSAIKILEGNLDDYYDWSADVMNPSWNARKARTKLKAVPKMQVCDALLEQEIFAGVGNIIKNEVLYRVRIHPLSRVGKIPAPQIGKLIKDARTYSFLFYEWKKKYELKKHWKAHTKKICQRCNLPFVRKHTGVKKRRSFFCVNCQELYK